MVFARDGAECPFCLQKKFRVKLTSYDSSSPSQVASVMVLVCDSCNKQVFQLSQFQDGQYWVVGVRICKQCRQQQLKALNDLLHKETMEELPKGYAQFKEERERREAKHFAAFMSRTTHPHDCTTCPDCGQPLRNCFWHGWNYILSD